MENKSNKLTTITAKQGQSYSVMGDTYRILISGRDTAGVYAAIDMLVPPLGGPGPHAHAAVQEAFYIIEGEIEFKTPEGTFTAKKGDYLNIPAGGMVHQFKNKSANLSHMICIVTPAGMEDMFREIGHPVQAETFLPPPALGPEELQQLQQVTQKYGQQIFPPGYLDK